MSKDQQNQVRVRLLVLCLVVSTGLGLTVSEISQKCHCDLTSAFCDWGCCCDTDCGSSISESCFYSRSSFYCPKTDFFRSLKAGTSANNICYYYNASTTLINEQSLTNSQRNQIISSYLQSSIAASSSSTGYKGYKMSSLLTIGGKSAFSFADSNGDCLKSTPLMTGFSFRFGHNIKISCKCVNCGTPLLFSSIMGKTLPQFLDVQSNDLALPTVTDTSMTTLKINFILGTYGSQKIKFIDKVTYSYDSTASDRRTLYFNFIDSAAIKEQQDSASFFPQIPIDMFYPIHVMS